MGEYEELNSQSQSVISVGTISQINISAIGYNWIFTVYLGLSRPL